MDASRETDTRRMLDGAIVAKQPLVPGIRLFQANAESSLVGSALAGALRWEGSARVSDPSAHESSSKHTKVRFIGVTPSEAGIRLHAHVEGRITEIRT